MPAYGSGADVPEAVSFTGSTVEELEEAFSAASVLATEDEDVRSLREFIVYGLKGLAAYADHAAVLGYEDESVYREIVEELSATIEEHTIDELTGILVATGNTAVKTMALLDSANTGTYGHPEITRVNIGTGSRPAILISGHDLRDMAELLEQTKDAGVDVYTHSEMLPANYYPAFKKYDHFVGNYGGSWYKQGTEFASFNGPILMTTNCITPVRPAYRDRIFTTGMAGYPGVPHIADREDGKPKDFSRLIELAKTCDPPEQIEEGEIVGGFAHHQVEALADKVVDAVKSGAIRKFVVMGGCDGRQKSREYFTDLAKELPARHGHHDRRVREVPVQQARPGRHWRYSRACSTPDSATTPTRSPRSRSSSKRSSSSTTSTTSRSTSRSPGTSRRPSASSSRFSRSGSRACALGPPSRRSSPRT